MDIIIGYVQSRYDDIIRLTSENIKQLWELELVRQNRETRCLEELRKFNFQLDKS